MGEVLHLPGIEPKAPERLEVHEHCFVSGPRRGRFGNSWPAGQASDFEHSHPGGNEPHSHPDTGPASYTIDKDEWLRMTGLSGGGRKKFTTKPSGDQLPFVPRTPEESSFEIIMSDPPFLPPGWDPESSGGGHIAAAHMVAKHKLTPVFTVVRPPGSNPNARRA